jgi:hypothetical protein
MQRTAKARLWHFPAPKVRDRPFHRSSYLVDGGVAHPPTISIVSAARTAFLWADAGLDCSMWTVRAAGRQHQVAPCPAAVW